MIVSSSITGLGFRVALTRPWQRFSESCAGVKLGQVCVRKEIPADMLRWLCIALLAATVAVPLSQAQRGMGRSGSAGRGGFSGRLGLHNGTRPYQRGRFWGSPFLDPGLYPGVYGDLYPNSGYGESYVNGAAIDNFAGALPQVVMRGDAPRKTMAPLLIEWRGDRYVRFGGAGGTEERGNSAHPDYAEPAVAKSAMKSPSSATQSEPVESSVVAPPVVAPVKDLPPAVLVYRDGHREEIGGYAIADGVIYVRGEDWQDGRWTKRIPLSALDPAATVHANQERGAKFLLPSASNVVVASF